MRARPGSKPASQESYPAAAMVAGAPGGGGRRAPASERRLPHRPGSPGDRSPAPRRPPGPGVGGDHLVEHGIGDAVGHLVGWPMETDSEVKVRRRAAMQWFLTVGGEDSADG